ncbi:hypothetical protein [Lysobacter sp. CA199]|uniref:hypothetical protein n=1 Tax=Lysobacter sp. CA199 TaxID=3455608 RepID=UPI003F8D51A2
MRRSLIDAARLRGTLLLALCALAPTFATAQGFSALVSPPRFEDRAGPGTVYRNVVEITNVSGAAARYSLKTADWHLDAQGSAVFDTALAPGSCRPWVGLEAAQIQVPANGKRRYRFEVAVPADAPVGECRFAILLEGDPEMLGGALALPVSGRIGIIVYLGIGDAAARLRLIGTTVGDVEGRKLPLLQVRNDGNAHTRLEGLIDGTDGNGRKLSFIPGSLPLMPGETRTIALNPQADDDASAAPTIVYPLQLKGALDWDKQRLPIDTRLDP